MYRDFEVAFRHRILVNDIRAERQRVSPDVDNRSSGIVKMRAARDNGAVRAVVEGQGGCSPLLADLDDAN